MRIAFVITRGDSIGGAQIHVRDMAVRLAADGHQPVVLLGSGGDLTAQMEELGIPCELVPDLARDIDPLRDLAAVTAVAAALRRLRPDIVSTHTSKAGFAGRLGARLAGIPAVFTAHGWSFAEGVPRPRALVYETVERALSLFAARIIAVSDYDYALARCRRVASARRLLTIRNGMPDRPPPFAPASEAGRPRQLRMIMTARFQEQKDHETLFRALAGLRPDWRLELIGDGPLLDRCRERVQELGIADRVAFSGQVRDVPERLEKADLFVLTSHWEGFPRSVLEAMRAGLPVLATDVGGTREAVLDGETGFLVPRADATALRDRLEMLMRDGDLRARMGRAGRRRFAEEFTFETMYSRTLAVYREVLADS